MKKLLLLKKLNDFFDKIIMKLRSCELIECIIPTGMARPECQRAYGTALNKSKEVSKQIDEMLAQNIIRPSVSPWESPITLVPKEKGELRFSVDHRMLNAVTSKDAHPLPLIQDIFDQLQGAMVFSTMDLAIGSHKIPVDI